VNKRLYVGGLSYNVNDDGLRELFEPFGEIRFVKVIRDFHSDRSKGFGFVEMGTPEEAKAAIDALHDSIHEGRTITVSEANPPDSTGGSRGGARGGSNGGRGRMGAGGGGGMMGGGGGRHRASNGGGSAGRHHREDQY